MYKLLNKYVFVGLLYRTYRFAGYRQFVMWIFGKLGKGNRQQVPACAVHRLRTLYPEPSGVYTGFTDALARLQVNKHRHNKAENNFYCTSDSD